MHGQIAARFAEADGRTRLADLHQVSPLRLLFPAPAAGDPPTAALVTTSGGLVGGDSLAVEIAVDRRAGALVMAQAAEKIYRSSGADCRIDITLAVGPDGWLEFLPQETILFDGSRLRRRTRVEAAAGARLLAGEILVFGRTARGERLRQGLLHDAWQVRRDGRLEWAEALRLEDDIAARLDDPAGFAGATVFACLIFVVDSPAAWLPLVRARLAETDGQAAATVVNGVLVVRWLGRDGLALRRSFAAVWTGLRQSAGGYPARLPRLWEV
jgi:urease accessory protein